MAKEKVDENVNVDGHWRPCKCNDAMQVIVRQWTAND